MPDEVQDTVRKELLEVLMKKVETDTYPSSTMLDMIESLLTPNDVARYADVLLEGIRDSQFPSISMLQRVQTLA